MGRPLEPLVLSGGERVELGALAARRKTAQALALRARIVLLAGDGMANKAVAARLGIDPVTVGPCLSTTTPSDASESRLSLLVASPSLATTL